MASTPEELTIRYSEGEQELVKELDKAILTRGAWTTILYRYQEWEPAKQLYSPEKYSIRRYQKRNGEYMPKTKFNISSIEQARAIVETLQGWIEDS